MAAEGGRADWSRRGRTGGARHKGKRLDACAGVRVWSGCVRGKPMWPNCVIFVYFKLSKCLLKKNTLISLR